MCTHSCEHMYAERESCACTPRPGKWRSHVNLRCHLFSIIHQVFEMWCLSSLGTCWFVQVISLGSPKDPRVPPSLVLGLQLHTATPSLFMWTLGIGLRSWCMHDTLPSPSPFLMGFSWWRNVWDPWASDWHWPTWLWYSLFLPTWRWSFYHSSSEWTWKTETNYWTLNWKVQYTGQIILPEASPVAGKNKMSFAKKEKDLSYRLLSPRPLRLSGQVKWTMKLKEQKIHPCPFSRSEWLCL